MARHRVLSWRAIATQVRVSDDAGATIKRPMPPWYMQEISRITMREGIAGTDQYLEEFAWSDDIERPGTVEEVANAVMAGVADRFGRSVEGQCLARTPRP